ncbi:dienelactone hydrolase family protein [Chitinispirillales bacterium ANBcel5]|uniref:dienelactone hydrolase family protein n=1 Tax=Cellulosispirillum alkaliphilum TaxID=3039283 RepID=UPI002A520548|nr:dienelactone hydrolase family protein [Chitinispirillales bacterium ANBcel5]
MTENRPVAIPMEDATLEGLLSMPVEGQGMVIFAHGAGSGFRSPRNEYVARTLRNRGLGTLLFDLLTEEEDMVYENRFDTTLITARLVNATRWLLDQSENGAMKVGYFGASTGAAAALMASARLPHIVKAVVSRGGRPDMARAVLSEVLSPTLFIVGGLDEIVIDLNQKAFDRIQVEKDLKIIPGATHLFEEPGKLEEVARVAGEWFSTYLLA